MKNERSCGTLHTFHVSPGLTSAQRSPTAYVGNAAPFHTATCERNRTAFPQNKCRGGRRRWSLEPERHVANTHGEQVPKNRSHPTPPKQASSSHRSIDLEPSGRSAASATRVV